MVLITYGTKKMLPLLKQVVPLVDNGTKKYGSKNSMIPLVVNGTKDKY